MTHNLIPSKSKANVGNLIKPGSPGFRFGTPLQHHQGLQMGGPPNHAPGHGLRNCATGHGSTAQSVYCGVNTTHKNYPDVGPFVGANIPTSDRKGRVHM